MDNKEKFYITTAIAYTSKKPHIGNVYEIVLTDAIARFKRQQGRDVYFLTGTDEHGQKIQDNASEANISPKEYVDKIAGEIKGIWDLMGASYDKFIRTTDEEHTKGVQKIFKKLYDQGDIYKSKYEGLYCVPCESFFTQSQAVDGKCPDCGRELTHTKEEAYFLRLTKYQDKLMKHIEENPSFIEPESRKKEMVNNFLKPGLQDLCVSRTSFNWGIPVTFDEKHVVYVWVDALSNYITALGYDVDSSGELYAKYWPADVHVIGKDILRFHTIYWPIILMALGEPLPKKIFGHPWLLFGDEKMSKSRGNVIYAEDLVEEFGVDALRYYLLHEIPFAADGSITHETVIARFNSDLANTIGNLVNRTVAMDNKYFDGEIKSGDFKENLDNEFICVCENTAKSVISAMDAYRVSDALEEILSLARRSNKYIDETMPWALAKDESAADRLGTVLYNLIEALRYIGVLLESFMPETSKNILEQINSRVTDLESLNTFGKTVVGTKVNKEIPIFVRIDEKKKLEEIQLKIQQKTEKIVEKETDELQEIPEFISIDDFAKLDLKIGEVVESKHVKGADKLLVSQIKIGTQTCQIVSGIAKFYNPDEFVGKKVIVITNLKPVKLRGVLSEGMILAASDDEGNLKVCTVDGDIASGSVVK